VNQQSVPLRRLEYLLRIVEKEKRHLLQTDQRLFLKTIDAQWLRGLDENPNDSEQLDAFATRFARLQDTIGDKLVPVLLTALAETSGSALDNLKRMEKLGLLQNLTEWLEARALRNRMVHEYVEDDAVLLEAVRRAHQLIPLLQDTAQRITLYAHTHLPVNSSAS
jgi:hypothetical protein